ncbi:hypothetical protein KKC22_11555, partial [Myxococcota bacterium]|nr:hypothetical protein [Myxococcota bacterium]
MEFLELNALVSKREFILDAARELVDQRGLHARAEARQWKFFLHCVERSLDLTFPSCFDALPAHLAAQYKFEVENRLRRFYLGFGPAPAFVFVLAHRSQLDSMGYQGEPPPTLAGYCVLVRESTLVQTSTGLSGQHLVAYLERIVSEAVDAEFRAYQSLPDFDAANLSQWFWEDGPAHSGILNILTRHRERNWVLTNPYNPSCKRLMRLRILEVTNEVEARVRTQEYWHLYWWNQTL